MNRIKKLRTDKGLTLKQLANELNTRYGLSVSDGQLSNYENGNRQPRTQETWESLAKFFEVSVSYLMGISEEPSWIQFGTPEPVEIENDGKKAWVVQQELSVDALDIFMESRTMRPGSMPVFLTDILDGSSIFYDETNELNDDDRELFKLFVQVLVNKHRKTPYVARKTNNKTEFLLDVYKKP
ncbi:hypothetical protein G15_0009 [Enterococcus avium]|nr:hypothetical protein G15_0009 [Enterococcus avium]